MSPNAIPILVFSSVFAAVLIVIGRKLFSIRSYEQHLMAYKENPSAFGWFEKYFLRWGMPHLDVTEKIMKFIGYRLVTAFYRFTGILFIIVGAMFIFFALAMAFGS